MSDPGSQQAAGGPTEQPGQAPPLSVGRVGRSHGLDGSFYVTRPLAQLLGLGAKVTVAGVAREVVRRSGTDAHPIVRLDGIADRAAAEQLRGLELTVAREQAPPLHEGEWWAHELEGCEVFDGQSEVGTVARLLALPSCEVLEVSRAGGGPPLLVPMVKAAIRNVDPRRRRVDVDLEFLGEDPP